MAWLHQLAVECGDVESAATACAEHFTNPGALPAEVAVEVAVTRAPDDGAWWASIVPSNESRSGVYSKAVARSLTAAGVTLLDRLRGAPPFRFALIGVEAEQAISLADFEDPTLAEGRDGLVVSEALLARLDNAADFKPFAPGYHWIPYRGERFVPDD